MRYWNIEILNNILYERIPKMEDVFNKDVFNKAGSILHSMDVTEYDLVPRLTDISIRDISMDSLKEIITEWINDRIQKFDSSFAEINKLIQDKGLKVIKVKTFPDSHYIDCIEYDTIYEDEDFTAEDLVRLIETHNEPSIVIYNNLEDTNYGDTNYEVVEYNDDFISNIIKEGNTRAELDSEDTDCEDTDYDDIFINDIIKESKEEVELNSEDREKIKIANKCLKDNISKLNNIWITFFVIHNNTGYPLEYDSWEFSGDIERDLLATFVSLVNKTIEK